MTVQPAIITFADEPEPTTAQRDVWWRANLNAALVFERMVGRAPRVDGSTAIVIRSTETLRQDVYEMMTTVGAMPDELAAVRASPLWDFESTAEYLRVYITDRERMINRGYPAHQVMGTGLATQEYRA